MINYIIKNKADITQNHLDNAINNILDKCRHSLDGQRVLLKYKDSPEIFENEIKYTKDEIKDILKTSGWTPLYIYTKIVTGTDITLPNNETYQSGNGLKVYLNGALMEEIMDYNIQSGTPPFSTIQMTFDLEAGDQLRFEIGE